MPVLRIILTFLVIGFSSFMDFILFPIGNTFIAEQAGKQLLNSNTSYYEAYMTTGVFNAFQTGINVFCLLLLIMLWWRPAKDALRWLVAPLVIVCSIFLFGSNDAWAYYKQEKWPEPVIIMNDESFFWIPNSGDNLDSQVAFSSIEYYKSKKIPSKLFEIPHVQLPSSSYWKNYWVSAGHGIIVSRRPYASVWTASSTTGTSHKDQSFNCQSSEGLNIRQNMSIGAHITEEQASAYLYNFPVKGTDVDRTNPEVIFTSVYYAPPLTEAMDTVIWGFVSKTFCNRASKYKLKDFNLKFEEIMTYTEETAKKYMDERGITLDYLGGAGSPEFDPKVQEALNDVFQAETIKPFLDVLTTKAELTTMMRWNGVLPALPSFGIIPENLFGKATDAVQKTLQESRKDIKTEGK